MRILILAYDDVFDTGLAAVLDAFSLANKFSKREGRSTEPFKTSVVGVRAKVRSGLGFQIPIQSVQPTPKPDWVILPAIVAGAPAQLVEALGRRDLQEVRAHVLAWAAKGTKVAAACIGTFILAEAGLLDEREATTTWWLAPFFRQRYPKVLVDETRMLVPTDVGVTAGAAMGHMDLALWLIRQSSPDLASMVARYLLADVRSSQIPYIVPSHLAQADPLIQRFERWARANLKHGFSLQDVAKSLAVGPRTLQRRCNDVLGKSPLEFFQDLRVERARTLIAEGDLDIEHVAAEVGYIDGATLRALLRQRLGRSVRELRSDL
jgi:transcriptional regulator GlxA family with amidase domain